MKTLKLVLGILCIAFSVIVVFQSCAAGVVNTLSDNGEVSGTAGMFTAFLMLSGGIVMVATRASERKGGAIACIILFLLGALLGFSNAGSFGDLNVWAALCLILAVVNVITLLAKKKKDPQDPPAES